MKRRLEKLREKLKTASIDAVLIENPENRRYLSGFTGTAGMVLVTREKAFLLTDFRYTEQAKGQAPHLQVVQYGAERLKDVAKLLDDLQIETLAFEEEHVTFKQYRELRDKLTVTLEPVRGWVEELRLIKNRDELETLKKAVRLADEGFSFISRFISPGKIEQEVSLELEFYMRRQGASGPAFDFIVASGYRGALPHGVAGDKKIQPGDLVVMDFGAVYCGYHSDITRTVAVGKSMEKQEEIYRIVLEAQLAAIDIIKPGLAGAEVDEVAREIISNHGYGEYFGHGLGHGVGLAVHEGPRLAPNVDTVLEPGMVVTVEPGIYLPDWGGVRIEDMVLVTSTGCEILTGSNKEFLIV